MGRGVSGGRGVSEVEAIVGINWAWWKLRGGAGVSWCIYLQRLEAQLNDITELHQHAVRITCVCETCLVMGLFGCLHAQVDNLRTQLSQIEHTTTSRCQDFEDAIDEFQAKVSHCVGLNLA